MTGKAPDAPSSVAPVSPAASNFNWALNAVDEEEEEETAGLATISQYTTSQGVHFSINVTVGGQSLATEQVITNAANDTSIALNTSTNPVQSWTVALPNGQAAIDYSSGLLGANTGTYDEISNSCLSYCGNVLNAGGVNVPLNSSLGTYRFLNSLGQ